MERTKYKIGLVRAAIILLVMGAFFAAAPIKAQDEDKVAYVGPDMVKSWIEEGKQFTVLDVRTPAEFEFVGHPVGALNIPLEFWNSETSWSENPEFADEVKESLDKDATIISLCRSGGRARKAAEILKKIGYKSVFVYTDGFEGPKDERGLRTVSGWKVDGLPYTYEGQPYRPAKESVTKDKEKGSFKDPE